MKPLYKLSISEAKQNNETEQFWESFHENVDCRNFLDKQVGERFDGMYLPCDCAEKTVEKYGLERTMWVVANTILERKYDGRFHRDNVDWAQSLDIPEGSRNYEFALNSHSCLVDGLADQVREMQVLSLSNEQEQTQSDSPEMNM